MMKKITTALIVAFLALALPMVPAFAADIVSAKAQGQVGEQTDGLLGVVDPATAPADVSSMVLTINAERMAKYQAIADKNGTPVEQTQALAGQKLMGQTPAGQFVMGPDGQWMKK